MMTILLPSRWKGVVTMARSMGYIAQSLCLDCGRIIRLGSMCARCAKKAARREQAKAGHSIHPVVDKFGLTDAIRVSLHKFKVKHGDIALADVLLLITEVCEEFVSDA